MQKVKYGILNVFISVVIIAVSVVLSCFLFLPKKIDAETTLAQSINFISATTKIKQTEPTIINDKFYSPYTSDMDSFYLIENKMGEYVKFGEDYIKIDATLYCGSDGNFTASSISNISPTDYINVTQEYSNKILTISNCLLYEIDGKKYIYDGKNIYCYHNGSGQTYNYCTSNGTVTTNQTNYILISKSDSDPDTYIINLNSLDTYRYNAVFNYGYNYKQFSQYKPVDSTISEISSLFTNTSTINPLVEYYFFDAGTNEFSKIDTIYNDTNEIKISDLTELTDISSGYSLNVDGLTAITELHTLKPELYFNSPLGYYSLGNSSFDNSNSLRYTIMDSSYTSLADISAVTALDNLYIELIEGQLHIPMAENLFEKTTTDLYYNLYHKDSTGTSDALPQINSLKYDNNTSSFLNATSNSTRLPLDEIYLDSSGSLPLFTNVFEDNILAQTKDISQKPRFERKYSYTGSNIAQVQLDNYKAKNSLLSGCSIKENIENYYIAFGDIRTATSQQNQILSSLTVSATLKNKYYTNANIYLNAPVVQTELQGETHQNHYWFQYIDLENVWEIVGSDQNSLQRIKYPEGLYTFNFSYSTYNPYSPNGTSNNLEFIYEVYLYNTSSYSNYPSLNTNVLYEGNPEDNGALTYYYNFTSDEYPTYSFDPSRFSVQYSRLIDGNKYEYFTSFSTFSRSTPLSSGDGLLADEISYIYVHEKGATNRIIQSVKVYAKLYLDSDSNTYYYIYNYYDVTNRNENFLYKKTLAFNFNYEEPDAATYTYTYTFKEYKTYDPKYKDSKENKGDLTKYYKYTITSTSEKSTTDPIYTISTESTLTNFSDELDTTGTGKTLTETSYTYDTTTNSANHSPSSTITPFKFPNLENYQNDKYIFSYDYDFEFTELGEYELSNTYLISSPTNSASYQEIKNNQALNFNIEFKEKNYNAIDESKYFLNIFGVKSYFNKNGSTEFMNREEEIYSNQSFAIENNKLISSTDADFSVNSEIFDNSFTYLKTKYPLPKTNMPPITFNYFCSYFYKNDSIIPNSKMFKYSPSSYTYLTDNRVELNDISNPSTYYFNKNTYPTSDGFYIIVIDYKYATNNSNKNYKLSTKLGECFTPASAETSQLNQIRFCQVFAFVIDNSSPEIQMEKLKTKVESKTEISKSWVPLTKGSYTNTDVRITYPTPTYFQYDKKISLTKENYDNKITSNNYGSAETNGFVSYETQTYSQEKTTLKLSENTFELIDKDANNIFTTKFSNNLSIVPVFKILKTDDTFVEIDGKSEFIPTDLQYISKENQEIIEGCVKDNKITVNLVNYKYQFMVYSNNSSTAGNYWGAGRYNIKINYGSNLSSHITYKFTIDTLPIENIKICARVDDNDNLSAFNSQIINSAFTLTYDEKSSDSPITAKYKRFTFTYSEAHGANLVNGNNISAVSVNSYLNALYQGYDSTVYDYNYNPKQPYTFFTPTITTLFIFELTDSAGNTASHHVIYDNSTPKYTVSYSGDDSFSERSEVTIITDTTQVYWGNYKAIEISYKNSQVTSSSDLETLEDLSKFTQNSAEINYEATSFEKALKDIVQNSSSKYQNSLFKAFWKLKDGSLEEVQFVGDKFATSSSNSQLYSNTGKLLEHEVIEGNLVPIIKYYLLVPMNQSVFEFKGTNSNDNNKYEKVFNAQTTTEILLDVSQKKLAENYYNLYEAKTSGGANKEARIQELLTAIKDPSYTDIKSENCFKYGFFGEKFYHFKIKDILNNQSDYNLWMNFDKTQAWAYGTFKLEETAISKLYNHPLTLLINESAYANGQLYFSYLPENVEAGIPKSHIQYKYFAFDNFRDQSGFYSSYELTDIKSGDESTNYEYLLEYQNSSTQNNSTQNNSTQNSSTQNNSTKVYNIAYKNINEGIYKFSEKEEDEEKVIRNSPTPFYPFSIAPFNQFITNPTSPESNQWRDLFTDNTDSKSTYKNSSEPNRVYSSILQPIRDEDSSYLNSSQGLYVFKRTYPEYIDENGLVKVNYEDNNGDALASIGYDTPIRYYVYYVDRNSIIDVTNTIGSEISILLGAGKFEDEYKSTISYDNIDTIRYEGERGSSPSLTTFSSRTANDIFKSNKNLIQLTYSLDKYSAISKYKNYIKNNNFLNEPGANNKLNHEIYFDAITKYLFNLQNNHFFLNINIEKQVATQSVKFIDNNHLKKKNIPDSFLYGLNNETKTASEYVFEDNRLLNDTNYNQNDLAENLLELSLTDLLLMRAGLYTYTITDNAGFNSNTGENSTNTNCNSYKITFSITENKPYGYFFGKNDTSFNNTANFYESSICDEAEYKTNLLNDLPKLQDVSTENPLSQGNVNFYGYTNNSTLIFSYSVSSNDKEAQINPYVVTINKTSETGDTSCIFKINHDGENIQFDRNQTANGSSPEDAFIEDNESGRYLVVVYDKLTSLEKYHNILSDPSENARYSISIQFKGDSTYYQFEIGEKGNYFTSSNEIIVDHVKPLKSLINLMEKDVYYSHDNLKFIEGYNKDIKAYINSNNNLDILTLQHNMELIYNEYMKVYENVINNYFFAIKNSDIKNVLTNNTNVQGVNYIDLQKTYVRKIPSNQISEYKYSLTTDDYSSNNEHPGHEMFLESKAKDITGNLDYNEYYSLNFINNTQNQFIPGEYYEIIQKDSAQNYRVFGIYISDESFLNYSYDVANGGKNFGTIGKSANAIINFAEIFGSNLKFTENAPIFFTNRSLSDNYQKVTLTYSFTNISSTDLSETIYSNTNNPITIYSDPFKNGTIIDMNGSTVINTFWENAQQYTALNSGLNSFTGLSTFKYLQSIYTQIIKDYENTALDFAFVIKIYDRINGIITINFNNIGKILIPEFYDTGNLLKVVIPNDKEGRITKIIRFVVEKFENGYSKNIMDMGDARGNQITESDGGKSLGGKTYYFSNGVYRFTISDNFGRTEYVLKTYQTNTITNDISFTGPVINKKFINRFNQTCEADFTAKPIVVTYDSSFYNLKLEYNQDGTNSFSQISNFNNFNNAYFAIELIKISETGYRITISPKKALPEEYYGVAFRITLTNEADAKDVQVTEFRLYTNIPNFSIQNRNGTNITYSSNVNVLIEDFDILIKNSLDSKLLDFNTKIQIEFKDEDGHILVIKANNYSATRTGTYIIKTINDLESSGLSYTFSRDESSAILYAIYAQKANGEATKLEVSSNYKTAINEGGNSKVLIYHYYALSNYKNAYSSQDGIVVEDITKDHISIITNTNNAIGFRYIEYKQDEYLYVKIYSITGESTENTMHYLYIHFVNESKNFASLTLFNQNDQPLPTNSSSIKTTSSLVKVCLDSYYNKNGATTANEHYIGNLIQLSYSYNGTYIETMTCSASSIITFPDASNQMKYYNFINFSETGIYRITITDLAGNTLYFGDQSYIELIVVNTILYTINANIEGAPEVAIKNYITNNFIHLNLLESAGNVPLYEITNISIYRNGAEYDIKETLKYYYEFKEAGSYLITVTANVNETESIRSNIQFMIINSNYSILSFNISNSKSFEIVQVLKKSLSSPDARFSEVQLTSTSDLWLSSTSNETGNGLYKISLRWYHKGFKKYYNFDFQVRINNEIPTLYANIEFGTSSNKTIKIYYNPSRIFEQVGNSQLVVNGNVVAVFNQDNANAKEETYSITKSGVYWVQVCDPEGRVLSSYKVTKTTPLNSTAKILIIVGSIVTVALVVIFIIIRKKVRFK